MYTCITIHDIYAFSLIDYRIGYKYTIKALSVSVLEQAKALIPETYKVEDK